MTGTKRGEFPREEKMERAIDTGQIKMIHALKSALGMTDDVYRTALEIKFGVKTSKALTMSQADKLIADWQEAAVLAGTWLRGKEKYESMKERLGMASPAQLRMVEAYWKEVSRAKTVKEREARLRGFVMRIAKVSDLRFLDTDGVRKVVAALKAMKSRKAA